MLRVRPAELKEANEFVARVHRHHKPVVGHRWSLAVEDEHGVVHGVAICGRPVARMTDQRAVLEITRLATDGAPNACSKLYAAVANAARAMGFSKVQTFILEEEPGTSLKASGYAREATSAGGDWTRSSKPNRRQDQPQGPKVRWAKVFTK